MNYISNFGFAGRKPAGVLNVRAARRSLSRRIRTRWLGRLWSSIAGPFRRSIRVRFYYAVSLAILGLGLMATVALLSNRALMGTFETAILEARLEMTPANVIQVSLQQTGRLVQQYATEGDKSASSRFMAVQGVVDQQFTLLLANVQKYNGIKHAHSHVSLPDTLSAWKSAESAVRRVFEYSAGTTEATKAAARANSAIGSIFDEISEFHSLAMQDLQKYLQFSQALIYWTYLALFGTILVGLCLLIGIWLIMSRSILDPIVELQEAARKLGKKDFSHRVRLDNTRDELGQVGRAFNIASSALQQSYLELQRRSTHDGLTGAVNRAEFDQRLAAECSSADRHEWSVALLMVDIDFFKRVNDEHGHQAGDRVLQALVRLMQETMRPEDIVARYGGEEFAVILPATDADSALAAAERLRLAIEKATINCAASMDIGITVSIGCAGRRPHAMAPADIVKAADTALYRAKQTGRNRVVAAGELQQAAGTGRRAAAA